MRIENVLYNYISVAVRHPISIFYSATLFVCFFVSFVLVDVDCMVVKKNNSK